MQEICAEYKKTFVGYSSVQVPCLNGSNVTMKSISESAIETNIETTTVSSINFTKMILTTTTSQAIDGGFHFPNN